MLTSFPEMTWPPPPHFRWPGSVQGSGPLTLAGWICRLTEILALKPPTTRGTALDLFGVSLARVHVIEEHPLMLAFRPPELPPESVCVPARTI
jgi:hypothetical protein